MYRDWETLKLKEGKKSVLEVLQLIAEKENYGQAISHKEDNATLLNYFKERLKEERSDIERAYNAGKSQTSIDCPSSKYYFMNYITND